MGLVSLPQIYSGDLLKPQAYLWLKGQTRPDPDMVLITASCVYFNKKKNHLTLSEQSGDSLILNSSKIKRIYLP